MGGRSTSDNFKRRFGDSERIEIRYAKDKMTPSEDSCRSEQLSKVYAGVLKGILELLLLKMRVYLKDKPIASLQAGLFLLG